MATHQPDYYPPQGGGGGGSIFGKQILLVGLLALAIYLIYRVFSGGGSGLSNLFGGDSEVDLTYVPSDFQPNLDEESTLRILAEPNKYRNEFDALVYQFNTSLLYHVANRMNLDDSLKRRLEPLYKTHHDYLKTLYYNDFLALKDTSSALYDAFYRDHQHQAVRAFNEVAGKYTCFFVTQIMATLLKTNGGKLLARGDGVESPCAIALTEGLHPMMERLQKTAAINDFSASRGLLKEKVRKGIAELATYEIRDRKGLDKTLQYKFLGFNVSETNIEVEAISVIKAGFKLDDYFDVTFSPKKGVVFITLPPPTILSHEVYPRVDKLDVGFLAGVTGEDMNKNFNELRTYFRDDAIQNDRILDKARVRADSVMQLMFGPVVRGMNRNYKLELRFQGDAQPTAPAPQPPTLKK
jgi:Protein of unknown function (DUF4230)